MCQSLKAPGDVLSGSYEVFRAAPTETKNMQRKLQQQLQIHRINVLTYPNFWWQIWLIYKHWSEWIRTSTRASLWSRTLFNHFHYSLICMTSSGRNNDVRRWKIYVNKTLKNTFTEVRCSPKPLPSSWISISGNVRLFFLTILTVGCVFVERNTHLDAAVFINAVVVLWSSQEQTHFGSLALDQADHLSS